MSDFSRVKQGCPQLEELGLENIVRGICRYINYGKNRIYSYRLTVSDNRGNMLYKISLENGRYSGAIPEDGSPSNGSDAIPNFNEIFNSGLLAISKTCTAEDFERYGLAGILQIIFNRVSEKMESLSPPAKKPYQVSLEIIDQQKTVYKIVAEPNTRKYALNVRMIERPFYLAMVTNVNDLLCYVDAIKARSAEELKDICKIYDTPEKFLTGTADILRIHTQNGKLNYALVGDLICTIVKIEERSDALLAVAQLEYAPRQQTGQRRSRMI